MEGYVQCFEKYLSETDVSRNLEIPKNALHLPLGNENLFVWDGTGKAWMFRAPIRRSGRRSMAGQWREFAAEHSLVANDILKFYRSVNGDIYSVEIERRTRILFPLHPGE